MDKERYKLINELKFQYLSDMKDNNRKVALPSESVD
jgi:hypothetical protein